MLLAYHFVKRQLLEDYDYLLDQCLEKLVEATPCMHVQCALEKLPMRADSWSWSSFIDILQTMMFDVSCKAFDYLGAALLVDIADEIEKNCKLLEVADVLKETAVYKTAAGKRRRVDEDYKELISKNPVGSGVKSTTAAKFTDNGSESAVA